MKQKLFNKPNLNKLLKSIVMPFLCFDLSPLTRYSRKDFLDLLVKASIWNVFAEGASNLLNKFRKTPNADTLLLYLKSQDRLRLQEAFDLQVRKVVKHLKALNLLNKPLPLAVDWHDIMYYGNPEDEMVVGTVRKHGSNYAFQYLTVNVVLRNRRLTLAVVPLPPGREISQQTIQVIRRIRQLGVKIRYVTFDRGFYSILLLRFLEDSKLKYILHCPLTEGIRKLNLTSGIRVRYQRHRGRHNSTGGGQAQGLRKETARPAQAA